MSSAQQGSSVEGDLQDLTKKYRIVEGERKAYSEEGQAVLRKQKCAAAAASPAHPLAPTARRLPPPRAGRTSTSSSRTTSS